MLKGSSASLGLKSLTKAYEDIQFLIKNVDPEKRQEIPRTKAKMLVEERILILDRLVESCREWVRELYNNEENVNIILSH